MVITLIVIIGILLYICIKLEQEKRDHQMASIHYQRIIYLLLDEFNAGDEELFKQVLRWYVHTRGWRQKNTDWKRWSKTLPSEERFLGKVDDVKTAYVSYITQGIIENQKVMRSMKEKVPKNLTVDELKERIPEDHYNQ